MRMITKPAFASAFAVLLAGVLSSAEPSEAAHLKGSQSEAILSEYNEGNRTKFRLLAESDDDGPPVCQNNAFRPNVDKYYTIQSGSGLFWSAGSDSGGHDAFNRAIVMSTRKVDASSHWRFEDKGAGKWLIRNRMTGMIVDRDSIYYNLETLDSSKRSSDFVANGQCFGSEKVILKRASNHGEAAFCESNSCTSGRKIVVATPKVVQSKKTSCRYPRFLKSCNDYKSSSSPIWKQSKYGKCGWAKGKRYRICDEIRMEVRTNDPEEKWTIREVKEFKKPDVKAAPVVSVLQGTVDGIQDSLVKVGLALGAFIANNLVKNGAPGFGVLVSLGSITGQFGGKDDNEALAKLAAEILDAVDDRINQAIVKSDLEEAANLLEDVRTRYLIDYRADKRSRFQTNGQPLNQGEFLRLSGELEQRGVEYVQSMATMFAGPNDFSPTDINALRGQNAWPMMKLAMVETLMLYQEAVALDAFIGATFDDLTFTCDEIFDGHFSLTRLVNDLRDDLEKTREMLIKYRTDSTLSIVLKDKKCRVCTQDGCHSYTCGKTKVAVRDDIRAIQFGSNDSNSGKLRNLWNAELRNDMIKLSYPMEKELEFFRTYKENTMLLCETMMNNSTVREIFAEAI